MPVSIHPTAVVDPAARLGTDVTVGPLCVIEAETAIGDGCTLDAYVHVKAHTSVGARVSIASHACLGGTPQHLSFRGEPTTVQIGDDCIIREYVTVHRGTAQGLGHSRVGDRCMLMAYVHVAHDCELGNDVIMANASSLAGHVEIGNNAIVSGMSGVHQFVRIGEFAFLGAMGGFGQDVPPYTLATGVRAQLHGINTVGLKRNGFSKEAITALKKAYKLIFRKAGGIKNGGGELTREQAIIRVKEELAGCDEVARLVAFVESSSRGVTPHGSGKAEL